MMADDGERTHAVATLVASGIFARESGQCVLRAVREAACEHLRGRDGSARRSSSVVTDALVQCLRDSYATFVDELHPERTAEMRVSVPPTDVFLARAMQHVDAHRSRDVFLSSRDALLQPWVCMECIRDTFSDMLAYDLEAQSAAADWSRFVAADERHSAPLSAPPSRAPSTAPPSRPPMPSRASSFASSRRAPPSLAASAPDEDDRHLPVDAEIRPEDSISNVGVSVAASRQSSYLRADPAFATALASVVLSETSASNNRPLSPICSSPSMTRPLFSDDGRSCVL